LPTSRLKSAPNFIDRITAPLYPLAFVVLTYAYLGAPRTDPAGPHHVAHGRNQRRGGTARTWLRRHNRRACTPPIVLLLPYLALIATFVLGYIAISRGVIIEPPGLHRKCNTRVMERVTQRTNALMGKHHDRWHPFAILRMALPFCGSCRVRGHLVLTAMIDFLELLRRSADIKDVSPFVIAQITLFRVPFITERVMPFAVLVGAMFCYLNLSAALELAVARAAGVSAWQFISPAIIIAALIGIALTTIYNPISANLRELSTRLEADLSGRDKGFRNPGSGFWVRQRNDDGQAVINAKSSRQQGSSWAASAFSGTTPPATSSIASRPRARPWSPVLAA
jgi:hypothetical protein